MSKSFYIFIIFFLSLATVVGCLNSVLDICSNSQISGLKSYLPWFFTASVIHFICSLLTLAYHRHKQFSLPFAMLAIVIITNLSITVVCFFMLSQGKLANYYFPILDLDIIITIVYGITLTLSPAGKKPWLKASGLAVIGIGSVLLFIVTYVALVPAARKNDALVQTYLYASLLTSLIPVLLIKNYLNELSVLKAEDDRSDMNGTLKYLLAFVAFFSFAFAFSLGAIITSESFTQAYWGKKNFEAAVNLDHISETRVYVNSKGDTLRYHLVKPLNFDATKKYPLLVSLPYGGQPATDKIRQIEGAAAVGLLLTDENKKKYPAFIFVPNCPAGSGWGGIPGYPSVDTLVYAAINTLNKEPGIDTNRRYVTGISRGGYGTWHFICTRPNMFAAAIPICGGEDPKLAARITKVAVWAFHGALDRNVPVNGSRGMIAAMKKAGGNPKYTEFANEGHNIWYQVTLTPGLLDWLFAQKKN